jgi:hypothetical protein
MSYTDNQGSAATLSGPRSLDPIDNSLNQVTGVIESPTAARDAREALVKNGFANSEIHIAAGCDAPRALRRGGFLFAVEASTRVRGSVAADILAQHGAHTVGFVDRAY